MPEPDKSLGRKILGFFIKEDDTPTTAPGAAPPQPVARPTAAAPAVPVNVTPTAGAVDQKFAEHFANVLAQNNPPGPDYFEFREALRGLTNLGLPEDKQYQAAWASFKALGGSPDVAMLTNTAKQYVAALNNDRAAFGKSVEAALTERVGGLQTEQQRLQTENEALAKQILEIQNRIDANNKRLATIGTEMTEQTAKINQNRQNYDATFAHFTDQINGDIAKITQYLK